MVSSWGPPGWALCVGLSGGEDAVFIRRCNLLVRRTKIPYGLGALWWAGCSHVMIHPLWQLQNVKELLVCLSPLLSSTLHQLSRKPGPQFPLASMQSHTEGSHSTGRCAAGRDYLHIDKLSTSSFIHLTGCFLGWQHKVFILCTGYKPHISTCVSKMTGM